ncbi:MAG: glycoside hydrolase family 73 protein [Streptococcaceae bacterium]|nr:glycoside hydrolase family 73 protein [Streptococcaceae bacterium]MCL2681066.1 glycoside hydrolase family 73 protein [Streptococcaceae bacterium]
MKRKRPHKQRKIQWWEILLQVGLCIITAFLLLYNSSSVEGGYSSDDLSTHAQSIIEHNFIAEIAPLAQSAESKYGILSSITLAQACLESDFGQSGLSAKYHNIFGIKAYGDVPTVTLNTQEFENGQWITIKGQFRVYDSYEQSVMGHSMLFTEGTTWNPNQYASVLNAKDYKTAAHAVQNSGYATDPDYATKLITLIEKYHLNQYDKK